MKCSRRSTRSCASAARAARLCAALLACATFGAAAYAADAPARGREAALAAVEASVRSRLGGAAAVAVPEVIALRIEPAGGPIVAQPDPSARVGDVVRFALAEELRGGRTRRIGEISARITARSRVVKAARALAAGAEIGEGDVTEVDADLEGMLLRPLPAPATVLGARVRRPVAEGAIVAAQDIVPAPLVRAGRPVTVRVSLGTVVVTGQMIAAENGAFGEVVRVVNAETRRTERARVIAPAEVEMVDVR